MNPDWSANGQSIVVGREGPNQAAVVTLTAQGKLVRNLTPRGFQGQPSFSPDSAWVVYEREDRKSVV